MQMQDTLAYVDVIMAVFGAYLIFATLKMKKTMKIPNMLLTKTEQLKIRDREAFIQAIYKVTLFFSIAMTILGIIGMVNDWVLEIPYFNTISMVIFLIIFLYYMKVYQDARSKYTY